MRCVTWKCCARNNACQGAKRARNSGSAGLLLVLFVLSEPAAAPLPFFLFPFEIMQSKFAKFHELSRNEPRGHCGPSVDQSAFSYALPCSLYLFFSLLYSHCISLSVIVPLRCACHHFSSLPCFLVICHRWSSFLRRNLFATHFRFHSVPLPPSFSTLWALCPFPNFACLYLYFSLFRFDAFY